ncbi:hypothetical protein [Streptomyces phytohabitans]|uniref:hypothetical protein n=1 Tax=Streptomyces phytohabitans TaxID=1150371 RepID=UPI00345BB6E0
MHRTDGQVKRFLTERFGVAGDRVRRDRPLAEVWPGPLCVRELRAAAEEEFAVDLAGAELRAGDTVGALVGAIDAGLAESRRAFH